MIHPGPSANFVTRPAQPRCPDLAELPPPPAGRQGWPWTEASPRLPERQPAGLTWPRLTVVTPSFNQGEFLEETIRSVLLQNYPELEYFVLDGGSTDNSREVIERYAPWLSGYRSGPDGGQSHAINTGLQAGTGVIGAWLNSDDTLEPGALTAIANVFREHPDASLVFGHAYHMHRDGTRTRQELARPYDHAWQLTQSNAVPQPSAFFRRQAVIDLGGLDEDLHFAMDYDLWLRLESAGPAVFVPAYLSNMRIHAEAKTSSGTKRLFMEIREVAQRHGGQGLPAGHTQWLLDIHLSRAFQAYQHGDLPAGRAELGYVLQNVPEWRTDPSRLAQAIAERAWQTGLGQTAPDQLALALAEQVCGHLPAEAPNPKRLRHLVLGKLHLAASFHSYQRHAHRQVVAHAARAVHNDPRLVRNRGLAAIVARSLLAAWRPQRT